MKLKTLAVAFSALVIFGCDKEPQPAGSNIPVVKNQVDPSTRSNTDAIEPDKANAKTNDEEPIAKAAIKPNAKQIRFATYNVAMNRSKAGELEEEMKSQKSSSKIKRIAEIIQTVRPEVLLLNEFDYDAEGEGIAAFQKNFLGVGQNEKEPITYEHVYFQAVNTGVDSGFDLNNDGKTGSANDAYGFGRFPGQYGMVVLSQHSIDYENIRTFQHFLWKDMPDFKWPVNPETDVAYYDLEVKNIFRLSSKSHWDVPIKIADQTVHFLVCHPTPPVFDGDEDRNGCRNHDEIRFWADYVSGEFEYHYDDNGQPGSLESGSHFVIAGDLNADPVDGDSSMNAAEQLTNHPKIDNSFTPSSEGGVASAESQGKKNAQQKGNPAHDTGDFNDANVGNVRVDYCLPSKSLKILDSGVYWPTSDQPGGDLVTASDHRMVWIEFEMK